MKRAYKQKMEEQQQQTGGGLLDCFFTLHTGPHEPRFYKSEMIPNTTNPTFRSLSSPFHDWMNWHEAASTMVVICFWTRHSLPESAGLHFEPELGHHGNNDDFQGEFELLIEWQLDLNALTYICKTVIEIKRVLLCFFFTKNYFIGKSFTLVVSRE
jgi:hypothetical protein